MPVWQTVRLLREASLNKHQKILKHFMQHIVFFPIIRYRQIFCHFKTSSYLKNTWAGKAIPQETCPRFPRPSSEQQRLVAFSLLPRSCRTEFLGRFSLPRVGPGKDRRQDWTGGRLVKLPSTSNPRATHELTLDFFATFRKILKEIPKKFRLFCFLGEILHSFSYLSQNI